MYLIYVFKYIFSSYLNRFSIPKSKFFCEVHPTHWDILSFNHNASSGLRYCSF